MSGVAAGAHSRLSPVGLFQMLSGNLTWARSQCQQHLRRESWLINENPPRKTSRGNGKPFFRGVCRVETVGLIAQVIPTNDVRSSGLRRRIDPFPAIEGWSRTMTPGVVRACIAVYRGPGGSSWARLPGASLHPARCSRRCLWLFAKTFRRSDQWTSHSAYPRPAGRPLPFITQEGCRFSEFVMAVSPTD